MLEIFLIITVVLLLLFIFIGIILFLIDNKSLSLNIDNIPIDIKKVCDYIVWYNYKKLHLIVSPLKLQPFLYFAQAAFLNEYGIPLFNEDFEAWTSGPVIPKVYHMYKVYGIGNIPVNFDLYSLDNYKLKELSTSQTETLNQIINEVSKYSSSSLSDITRSQRPWRNNYTYGYYGKKDIIKKEEIRSYFNTHAV